MSYLTPDMQVLNTSTHAPILPCMMAGISNRSWHSCLWPRSQNLYQGVTTNQLVLASKMNLQNIYFITTKRNIYTQKCLGISKKLNESKYDNGRGKHPDVYLIVQMLKTKDKKKILKETRKHLTIYKGTPIISTVGISPETIEPEGSGMTYWKCWKEKKINQASFILYLSNMKMKWRHGQINTEFVGSRPTSQEI